MLDCSSFNINGYVLLAVILVAAVVGFFLPDRRKKKRVKSLLVGEGSLEH